MVNNKVNYQSFYHALFLQIKKILKNFTSVLLIEEADCIYNN